jgi:transcriptional regulator GlxA family with amidase domain
MPHTVAIVAFEGISAFHLSVPCMVFGDDLARLGGPRYELLICGERAGMIPTMSGFSIDVPHGLAALDRADTVIVPAWRDPEERPPEALLQALRAAHARGARVVGLCLGAFVLAEAGLLDGRAASTHWVWSEDFARKYPKVKLDQKVLYVDDGDILTSAGTAAAIDCCLHLLRCDGGQAQYIEQPLPKAGSGDPLDGVLAWAQAHLDQPLCLDKLAERAAMSRRNFTRRFKARTGATVAQWLLNHRLAAAQRLLETSDQAIDRIAELAGFGSTVSLRQQFTAAFSLSPAAYRKQFRPK